MTIQSVSVIKTNNVGDLASRPELYFGFDAKGHNCHQTYNPNKFKPREVICYCPRCALRKRRRAGFIYCVDFF